MQRYAGDLVNWARTLLPGRGLKLTITKRSEARQHRFVILPGRRIMERTFCRLSKFSRLARDHEFRTENREIMNLIASYVPQARNAGLKIPLRRPIW